jgi:acyl-CoA dehydrogenase
MSEHRTAVTEAVTDILRDHCTPDDVRRTEPHGWNEELWSVLAESGFTLISVPEEAGGSGGDLADACAVIQAAGSFSAAVPVAETSVLGGWALAASGLEIPAGPTTVATSGPRDEVRLEQHDSGWRVSGQLHRVPWARRADRLVLLVPDGDGHRVLSLATADLDIRPGTNLAGDSRDHIVLDGVPADTNAVAPAGVDPTQMRLRGALARAAAIAGALARMSELTIRYTGDRQQFGRPIARFQAVQRHIVRIAERAQATAIAVECAAGNARPEPDFFDAASAKIVSGEAASVAAAAAHQAHGAIGMTKEYELGQLSRRVWAWRDEFGSEARWSLELGNQLAAAGADALWPRIALGLHQSDHQPGTSAPAHA